MANEPEVIKHQMLETRASLAEKLETLEQQVVGTVQNATCAVTDTVDSVKEAVQSTVQMAKTSVQDTVEAVKDTFDISRQVRQHPWLMMGGSVILGYAGGCLLNRAERGSSGETTYTSYRSPSRAERDGGPKGRVEEARSARAASAPASDQLLSNLGQKFETEIHKLKGLAVGTMLGVVRDMIAGSAPPQISSELADIIDSATVKLGGRPIQGPVLAMFQQEHAGQGESQPHRRGSAEGSPFNRGQHRATGAEGTLE
jgi:ElaB/YqjD/DUF883 family membrane-anchored ribosome-binding protein